MDGIEGVFALLKDLEPVRFSQNLALFGIAWWATKGTIKKHFESIEDKLERMADSVGRLEGTLTKVEMRHSERLNKLENDIDLIVKQLNPDKRSY